MVGQIGKLIYKKQTIELHKCIENLFVTSFMMYLKLDPQMTQG